MLMEEKPHRNTPSETYDKGVRRYHAKNSPSQRIEERKTSWGKRQKSKKKEKKLRTCQ